MSERTCRGCRLSLGQEQVEGRTIPLGSHWIANHYQNKEEGFLGWLVTQPIKHRMTFSEMSEGELEEFGVVEERLEKALRNAYNAMHPTDPIEIVYLTRLGESTLPKPTKWHVHVHMVPRTASMKERSKGWEIQKSRERGIRSQPRAGEIDELMNRIRQSFSRQSTGVQSAQ